MYTSSRDRKKKNKNSSAIEELRQTRYEQIERKKNEKRAMEGTIKARKKNKLQKEENEDGRSWCNKKDRERLQDDTVEQGDKKRGKGKEKIRQQERAREKLKKRKRERRLEIVLLPRGERPGTSKVGHFGFSKSRSHMTRPTS